MRRLPLIVFAGLTVLASDVGATVYRCDLPENRVVYQEQPCAFGTSRTLRAVEVADPVDSVASAPFDGSKEPVIIGSPAFRERTRRALDLLKLRAPSAYAMVLGYVGRIQQAEHSGMAADAEVPTFLMSDATAMYSVTWAAAAIAHDSFHSKLYFDYKATHSGPVPPLAWGGIQAEVKCSSHQLVVMQMVGSSRTELDHATLYADGHHTKNYETKEERDRKPY